MSQYVGIKDHKRKRNKSGSLPKPLQRCKKHHQAKRHREQFHTRPHPKDQSLTGPIVPCQPVTSTQVRFGLEVSALQRRYPQVLPQGGQGRKQLRQRRMLGVQAIVARLPHHVPGKHVVVLIKRERLPMDDGQSQRGLYQKQNNNYRPKPLTTG